MSKVAIIGCGDVGATIAFVLTMKGLFREIALVNRHKDKALGEMMDLNHGLSFASPVKITAGGYEQCEGADVVVITAGASQEPGETRLDLVEKNTGIIRKIVAEILAHNPDPMLLMVTNPVDVLTHVALKESGLDRRKVIGSGTMLDSSRFRYRLSEVCGVDPRNVHAHMVGEHGDTELALWSRVNISGIPFDEYCEDCGIECGPGMREDIVAKVRTAAYRIIEKKGSTYYAISLAVGRFLEAVHKNQSTVLPVSSLVENYYDINDVCLSLPSVVGARGIENVLHARLPDDEVKGLRTSAHVLRESLDSVGY